MNLRKPKWKWRKHGSMYGIGKFAVVPRLDGWRSYFMGARINAVDSVTVEGAQLYAEKWANETFRHIKELIEREKP